MDVVNGYWKPIPLTTWTLQLHGNINTEKNVTMYNIDLWDASESTIGQLKKVGKKVICHFSAGTYEEWRLDENLFPNSVKGNKLQNWMRERWLDIRQINKLAPAMSARLNLATKKGCDGVELDNVDAYMVNNNRSGFRLSYNDQLKYNIWLAKEAHQRNLSVGLKNDLDQIKDLVEYFDWALNKQCWEYKTCDMLQPFIKANKAIFNFEHRTMNRCPQAIQKKFSSIQSPKSLDGRNMKMCNEQGQLVSF
ncbi:unnamed protein product [Rotaria magnacalcarata]|uniref:Glycoside-hydrolase family GH114 TIM-barrel domain-containing protein n=1 Tax=Rotaria magnacalcarata TaxID=392030 RepID=A0A815L0W0_9BILA|nr:unnamed protein product [Rotaria magnacalcarata]